MGQLAVIVSNLRYLIQEGDLVVFEDGEGTIDHEPFVIATNYGAWLPHQGEQQLVEH